MNCPICAFVITPEQKKTESECGCNYHTNCAIDSMRRYFLHHWPDVHLTCNSCDGVIFAAPEQQMQTQNLTPNITINARLQQPEFKADLKKYKERFRDSGAKLRLLNTALRLHYTGFSNVVRIHIAAIREAKNESLNAFKITSPYTDYIKALRSFNSTKTRFIRKYNLTHEEIRLLFPRGNNGWRRQWRIRPQWILSRKYRVKL